MQGDPAVFVWGYVVFFYSFFSRISPSTEDLSLVLGATSALCTLGEIWNCVGCTLPDESDIGEAPQATLLYGIRSFERLLKLYGSIWDKKICLSHFYFAYWKLYPFLVRALKKAQEHCRQICCTVTGDYRCNCCTNFENFPYYTFFYFSIINMLYPNFRYVPRYREFVFRLKIALYTRRQKKFPFPKAN